MTEHTDPSPLAALEDHAGIDPHRIDPSGELVIASDEVRCAVLRRLGHDIVDVDDASEALERATMLERHRTENRLAPTLVAWDGKLSVPVPSGLRGRPWTLRPIDADDNTVSRGFLDDDHLFGDLPVGFYELDCFGEAALSTSTVISAPTRTFDQTMPERGWGIVFAGEPTDIVDDIRTRAGVIAEAGGAILCAPSTAETTALAEIASIAAANGLALMTHVAIDAPTTATTDGACRIGLPPDAANPSGQDWDRPAPSPQNPSTATHTDLATQLASVMTAADIVRVDHISGLDRQWWHTGDPRDGVWVSQPLEERMAVLTLSSHRHECAVVGDDLGPRGPRINDSMYMTGVPGLHALRFDPFGAPPPASVSMLRTHDTTPESQWWGDLDDASRQAVAERAGLDPQTTDLQKLPTSVSHQRLERLGHSDAALVLAIDRDLADIAEHGDDWAAPLRSLDSARRSRAELGPTSWPPPGWWFGADDQHLFNEGSHSRLWHALGGRRDRIDGVDGVRFGVWAPNAHAVHVVGDFNAWQQPGLPLRKIGASGVWDAWQPGVGDGTRYKLRIDGAHGRVVEKTDPLGFAMEVPPATASIIRDLHYDWHDSRWMGERHDVNRWDRPISIYEVHLGSWRRVSDEGDRFLTYAEHIDALVDHVADMGFTHVELLPITEHPLYASWGYQTTGYFAATSRYGDPIELMMLIDAFHQAGVGVILDWVPSHFPTDDFALNAFDGTQLYEHADPREGFHPDWKSSIFNYGRHEVRSFLLSSARFWLEVFHIDGLRVDAVASMLYRDYSRGDDWVPNQYGGRENLEAISFLQQLNHEMYAAHPDILMIAEESTAWPGVTKSTDHGGLGFGYKWDMGWMNDTLEYFKNEPIHRQWHHNTLTFRAVYASSENYILPLSHDEVVHGKGSLLNKMPGDEWQRFANLRLLLGWQFATPGKKLLFMGSELAPWTEWNHDESLPWHLTAFGAHEGVLQWVAHCNRIYVETPGLHVGDTQPDGFRWIDANDAERSIYSFVRSDLAGDDIIVAVNATPVPRQGVMTGTPVTGRWSVLASSDDTRFGGGGHEHPDWYETTPHHHNGFEQSIWLDLPSLSITFLRRLTD